MTESYAKIEALIHTVTRDAVQISPTGRGSFPAAVWIPRSLIHGGDDLMLAKTMRDDRMTIRVMDWKAKDLDLLSTREAKQTEMRL